MDKFDKFVDEYCYEHLDCNSIALFKADSVPGKLIKPLLMAIKKEFVDKEEKEQEG